MATAKITLLGMENYLQSSDDSIFKYLTLPNGMDADTVKNNILLQGGEFEVLWSNPYFLQEAVKVWSAKWLHTFNKWYKAINIEYDPLYNYDRHEEWTVDTKSNVKGSATVSGDSTGDNYVTAYDSDKLHLSDENKNSSTSKTSDTSDATGNETRSGRAYGNIGVTTSQQMLQSEIDIARWNLVESITDIFIKEFCIMIYE